MNILVTLGSIRRLLGICTALGWILVLLLFTLGSLFAWALQQIASFLGPPLAPITSVSDMTALLVLAGLLALLFVVPRVIGPLIGLIILFWAVVNLLRMVSHAAFGLADYTIRYVLPFVKTVSLYLLYAWISASVIYAIILIVRNDHAAAADVLADAAKKSVKEILNWLRDKITHRDS